MYLGQNEGFNQQKKVKFKKSGELWCKVGKNEYLCAKFIIK